MGLAKKVTDDYRNKSAKDVAEELAAKTPFESCEDFFDIIDNYIKECNNVEGNNPFLTNCYPICIKSEPAQKYNLKDCEILLLLAINSFQSKQLGITIGDLYMSTKIVLCERPEGCDLLGSYSVEQGDERRLPIVRLFMDAITEEAENLECDRKYVTAAVYIHEMMHRFYDVRPDLGWKQSVKEIEEPMAEFAKLLFCEELKDEELQNIAMKLTKNLRDNDNYFYYALGAVLFLSKKYVNLIQNYRHVSLMMNEGINSNIKNYVEGCKKNNLEQQVEPLADIIINYATLFPVNSQVIHK